MFRLLHTSDWHLGQHFFGRSRAAEHEAFLDWLITTVQTQAVDAVVVAGDVFDTGTPPSYARSLYNNFVVRMSELGVPLVILGGNHDSVSTLDEARELLARLGTHVIGGTADDPCAHLIELNNRDGEAGLLLCALPFMRAHELLRSRAGQSAGDKQGELLQAMRDTYQAVYEAAEAENTQRETRLPIVATGHLTTVGATSSESVREIYIGSLSAFPADAFPPADYIALGHLHKPQQIGDGHIRYCGSPIPLSFDEARHDKQVVLVDLDEHGLQATQALTIPSTQPMQALSGDLDALATQLKALAEHHEHERPVWVEIEVQGDDYLSDLQNRIEAMISEAPIEVLRVRRARRHREGIEAQAERESLSELQPDEVFERRLQAAEIDDADQQKALRDAFAEALAAVQNANTQAEAE